MDKETDEVLAKLQRIQQLWAEMRRMKPSDLEYEPLLKQIRTLSAEYHALIEKSKKPK
jgi:hypothetical protein